MSARHKSPSGIKVRAVSSQWHRFVASSDDDSECAHPDCGLIVCDEVLHLIAVDCPAPVCAEASNSDGRCVMVPAATGPVCVYCARSGCYVDEYDDADDAEGSTGGT